MLLVVRIDDRLHSNKCPSRIDSIEGPLNQEPLLLHIPIVKDHSHSHNIGLWQIFLKEVSTYCTHLNTISKTCALRWCFSIFSLDMGSTGGRPKLIHFKCGCFLAIWIESSPAAPPASTKVEYEGNSNLLANYMNACWFIPVIEFTKLLSLSGFLQSSENGLTPLEWV